MKIITAIGDEELNALLRKEENIEVIGKDIQYQEGILETLEKINDVDMIAVSNLLPEELKEINESIEIVVFLAKENSNLENYLNSQKIYKIYYLDENGIEVFMNSLRNSNNCSYEIAKEIESLRQMILESGKSEKVKEEEGCTC